jgi:hypothetical protein
LTKKPAVNIMSAERTVAIHYAAGGRKNYISLDVPVEKLVNYSEHARSRYLPSPDVNRPFPEDGKRRTTSTEYDLGQNMNEDFARTIAIFIKKSDPTNPAPLTLDVFGEDLSLAELAQLWRVIDWGYRCPVEGHAEAIRDALRQKIYATAPFTFAHFKQRKPRSPYPKKRFAKLTLSTVTDQTWFDKGLFDTTLDRVTFLHVKGYLDDDTKVEIETYAKQRKGWWDSLLDHVGTNDDEIKKAAAEKEARLKREAEKKAAAERKAKAERRAREEARTKAGKQRAKGNNGSGKGKGKKPVAPFEHKDSDFPSLS